MLLPLIAIIIIIIIIIVIFILLLLNSMQLFMHLLMQQPEVNYTSATTQVRYTHAFMHTSRHVENIPILFTNKCTIY
jgi:uncharacterized protein YpmB